MFGFYRLKLFYRFNNKTFFKGGEKMKETLKVLAIFIMILGFFATGVVAKKGNPRKGKYLFRTKCRVCHKAGATGQDVGKELQPLSKTQSQWKRFFEKDKHKKKPEIWEQFKPEELEDIYTYLHEHAYDSPQPAKCH